MAAIVSVRRRPGHAGSAPPAAADAHCVRKHQLAQPLTGGGSSCWEGWQQQSQRHHQQPPQQQQRLGGGATLTWRSACAGSAGPGWRSGSGSRRTATSAWWPAGGQGGRLEAGRGVSGETSGHARLRGARSNTRCGSARSSARRIPVGNKMQRKSTEARPAGSKAGQLEPGPNLDSLHCVRVRPALGPPLLSRVAAQLAAEGLRGRGRGSAPGLRWVRSVLPKAATRLPTEGAACRGRAPRATCP